MKSKTMYLKELQCGCSRPKVVFLANANPLHPVHHSANSGMFLDLMLVLSPAAVSLISSLTTGDQTEGLIGKINKAHAYMHP